MKVRQLFISNWRIMMDNNKANQIKVALGKISKKSNKYHKSNRKRLLIDLSNCKLNQRNNTSRMAIPIGS